MTFAVRHFHVEKSSHAGLRRPHYAIADKHLPKFKKAFKIALRTALDEDTLGKVQAALEREDVKAAIAVVMNDDAWESLQHRLQDAYRGVVSDAAHGTLRKLPSRVKKDDTVQPPPTKKFGEKWIKTRAAETVKGITGAQRDILRDVIQSNFDEGNRPVAIVDQIRAVLGLLPSDVQKMTRRFKLHTDAGMSDDRAGDLVESYADQLLDERADRIAIRETTAAEAHGKQEAWLYAKDEGTISPQAKRVWVASTRPCGLCKQYDGQVVELDGTYKKGVKAPPLHDLCVCMETIVEPTAKSDDWFGDILRTYDRIGIVGGPSSGKTTLSGRVTDRPVIHTDDYMHLGWSEASETIAKVTNETIGPLVVEGVRVPHALRKGMLIDAVLFLEGAREFLNNRQGGMGQASRGILLEWSALNPQVPVIWIRPEDV